MDAGMISCSIPPASMEAMNGSGMGKFRHKIFMEMGG
jgi:hypothetical protein